MFRSLTSLAVLAGLLLCAFGLTGCKKAAPAQGGGAPRTHEAVVEDAVTSMRNAVTAMESVHDARTAEPASQAVRQEVQKLRALAKELAGLGKASGAERQRVKQHDQAVISESQAMLKAVTALNGRVKPPTYPRGVATTLLNAISDYGEAMTAFGQQLDQVVK